MTELLFSLLRGVPITLVVTFGSFLAGAITGVPLVLMRRARSRTLQIPARIYVDVVRGIPPIVWLFIIFFGIGSGIVVLSSAQAVLLGMGLVSAAYLAETYRGGFLSLHTGQNEAATALGMSRLDTFLYVLAPQVLRVSIPPMATFFVSLLKDTTVASTVGVRDIMMLASQEAQSGGGSFAPFIFAAFLYIVLSTPIALFSRVVDERLRSRGAR